MIGTGTGTAGLPEQNTPEQGFGRAGASLESSTLDSALDLEDIELVCELPRIGFRDHVMRATGLGVRGPAQSNTARAIDVPATVGKPRLEGRNLIPFVAPLVGSQRGRRITKGKTLERIRDLC